MSFKKKLVLFDFDGTLTDRDTLFDFLKFNNSVFTFYSKLLMLVPIFALLFFKIISNSRAKEIMLTLFLKNTSQENFQEICKNYARIRVPLIIRAPANEEIKQYKKLAIEIAVVTASPENWVKPWCDSMGIFCIGTKLEIKNSVITGKIDGKNCYGEEKVARINRAYNLNEIQIEAAYGDSNGDRPMLNLAKRQFYKPFR